ncbi:LytTR family DNA-binding domain-containing protein [Aliisedimentitalea scapharcae]|uniref:LytTR family DNA-binding domain-containing protein n=1 Tax=Aliisedimentitalea scapharcae TaxID=1524259 RepID=A0ABZ2XZH3_9RHOB
MTIFLSEVVAVAPMCLAVSLVVTLILRYAALPKAAEQLRKPSDSEEAGPPLNSLIPSIPPSLGNDIIRMHAQDHYVQIVTTKGSSLLTEQFGDCVEKLRKLDGMQCHRSHWICLGHARDVTRKGSSYTCTLSNGDQIPVSRRRYSELKARHGFGPK